MLVYVNYAHAKNYAFSFYFCNYVTSANYAAVLFFLGKWVKLMLLLTIYAKHYASTIQPNQPNRLLVHASNYYTYILHCRH